MTAHTRSLARLLVAVALVVGALALPSGLPPDAPSALGGPRDAGAEQMGSSPLDDILYWADQKKACGLSRDQLAALMLAPIYPEVGAGTSSTPSPMTLSRYDTQSALYAFGSSSTAYPSAFWHPGVGMWQFDSAGAWNLTAATAIYTWTSAQQAATTMASRWCSSGSRSYVWAPWHGCGGGTCEAIYQRIYNGSSLVGVHRDTSVGSFGGMEQRECSLSGAAGTFPCWYVDPGRAQGLRSWTVPAWGRSPVTSPFYVFDRNGREERHWLSVDSGYAIGVRADKPITANARTSLTWRAGEVLCDETLRRGSCTGPPPPPPGPELPDPLRHLDASVQASGIPLLGDFDGNGKQDALWYSAGPTGEVLLKGGAGGLSAVPLTVNFSYWPIVGDFNADGADDVIWYAPGTARDSVWFGTAFGFLSVPVTVNGTYWPVVGDLDGDGRDDVMWVSPGTAPDYVWWGRSDLTFDSTSSTAYAAGSASVGDFDGDGRDDLFWYTPDASADTIWWGKASRSFGQSSATMSTSASPLIGDYDGNGTEDILWYGRGREPDALWFGRPGQVFDRVGLSVNGYYDRVVVGDLDGQGGDDVVWYRTSNEPDYFWFFASDGTYDSAAGFADGDHLLLAGDWFGDGDDDVLWVDPSQERDGIWTSS